MATTEEIQNIFDMASGTEMWHREPMTGILYTDSVMQVAEAAGAYWLILETGLFTKHLPFELWILKVKGHSATLEMFQDTGLPAELKKDYEYTDFPEGEWKFYFIDNVMLLPGDY